MKGGKLPCSGEKEDSVHLLGDREIRMFLKQVG